MLQNGRSFFSLCCLAKVLALRSVSLIAFQAVNRQNGPAARNLNPMKQQKDKTCPVQIAGTKAKAPLCRDWQNPACAYPLWMAPLSLCSTGN